MSKEDEKKEEETPLTYRGKPVSERGWLIRSGVMVLLLMAFVVWQLSKVPGMGANAYWWALGLGALLASGFALSYYYLFKKE